MQLDLSDLSNFDVPAFPVAVAAAAASTNVGTMRSWFQRKRIALHRMDAEYEPAAIPEKGGLPRLLTYRTVLGLATAAAMVRLGVDVADAYRAAKGWTQVGAGWDKNGSRQILPASLFSAPEWTFLIYRGLNPVSIVAAEPAAGAVPLPFTFLFGSSAPAETPPIIIWLNSVERHARIVCEAFLSK